MALTWLVLWPDHGLVVNSSGIEYGIVLYLVCGVNVWPVMAYCVDCFVGISYVTTVWASLMPQLVLRIKSSLLEFE